MAAAGVAGVRNSHSQRTRIHHGNTRAKLSNYIGQVFECKADNPYMHIRLTPVLRENPRSIGVYDLWHPSRLGLVESTG
jgi:hypothetical protein